MDQSRRRVWLVVTLVALAAAGLTLAGYMRMPDAPEDRVREDLAPYEDHGTAAAGLVRSDRAHSRAAFPQTRNGLSYQACGSDFAATVGKPSFGDLGTAQESAA